MLPPTTAQERGLTFAPIPCAVASFFSSSYVIYYLLCKERQKLERLYHRLVLSMNFALLPLSFGIASSSFAAPEGTPDFFGASGTVETCTAQGFVIFEFHLVVSIYYMSLSLQAFMGMRNNFKEENYRWIEKYIHIVAYLLPTALSIIAIVVRNFNPMASFCFIGPYPSGCGSDIPCQRGKDVVMLRSIAGFSVALICLITPPSAVIGMCCLIRKVQKQNRGNVGMQQIRDRAQKAMMKSIAVQISLYLFSFWFSFLPTWIVLLHRNVTGEILIGPHIFANCLLGSQGIILAVVYFSLQKLGKPNSDHLVSSSRSGYRPGLTVEEIRANAQRQRETGSEPRRQSTFIFNIFDGVPDEDSPWARFIDQDDYDDGDADMVDEKERAQGNEHTEQISTKVGTGMEIDATDESVN